MRRKLVFMCVVFAIAAGAFALPCSCQIRDGEGWTRSANRIGMIGLGIQGYYEHHGHLPPAVVRDKDGRPLYSWRVALLPYIEESRLYEEFRTDEPWDGPNNKRLLEKTPRPYTPWGGTDDPPGTTRYQVFVGPGTAFERDGLTWADFPDGAADTILVAEAGEPVPWSKPADLAYAPDRPLPPLGAGFKKAVKLSCYVLRRDPGFCACFGDGGRGEFIRWPSDEATVRGLITRNGGESIGKAHVK